MKTLPVWVGLMSLLAAAGWGWAQEAQDEAAPAAPEEEVTATPPTPEPPASPPPGEDVMYPTAHGIRFTPKMIDGFAKQMVKHQFAQNWGPDDPARQRLTEAVAQRCEDLHQRYAREGAIAVETFYEAVIRHELLRSKAPPPEVAREYSEKIGPGVKILREFWDGVLEDARPLVNDEQYDDLKKQAADARKMLDRFEQRMDRWSRGEMKKDEGLLDDLDEADLDDPDNPENQGKSKEYVEAERRVRWKLWSMGPEHWQQFLAQTVHVLGYDAAQKAAGEKLLKEYREKAKPVMTKEWKAKVMANQVRHQLEWMVPKEPLDPWLYRLDLEYREWTRPIVDMGRSFRRDVIALAAPEQRVKLLDDLRKVGTDHGMKPEELTDLLRFPQTQPQTQ
ncbi:MAG: hypothetical protein HY718_03715 [Planctomycetes bacterium]|nr:hypothetical protein [Planctomycetota bacterium]